MTPLALGFMPLTDAAPLIVARELGFAAEEGLALDLRPAPSWATLRDWLAAGAIEGAHMLSPVPVSMAMGLSGPARFEVLQVLSINGNVIGVSRDLAERLRDAGHDFGFDDAAAAGRALFALGGPIRIGVPFPLSMHRELLSYWFSALGLPGLDASALRTVPPPLMAEAMAAGEIDAFCVGEPWGSMAVETGVGALLLPGAAIWRFAPEKVLATRTGWAEANPEVAGALLRAVWKAGRWLYDRANRSTAADILSGPDWLGLPADVMDRALLGEFVISPRGEMRRVEGFVRFHAGAAQFPWKSQAVWIATRLATAHGMDAALAADAARPVFRSDLYRRHLRGLADLPAASEKVEGMLSRRTQVKSETGEMVLEDDAYFDGRPFDPSGFSA